MPPSGSAWVEPAVCPTARPGGPAGGAVLARDSAEGHQFQRPRSMANEGTSSVRIKNVSRMTPKAMLKPSC